MTETRSEVETETRQCETHGEYQAKTMAVLGSRKISSRCPVCVEEQERKEADQARKAEAARRDDQLRELRRNSGIPRRFVDASFSGYQPASHQSQANHAMCRAYAEQFASRMETGGGLVLCGKPGTGKTHLACAIGNHVIETLMRSVVYTSVTKLSRTVKATYSNDAEQTEQDAIRSFVVPHLLIVDEVGAQRGSETELLLAQEIIDERYQDLKPTIIISNLTESELSRFVGERALDRMYEGGGAVLAFNWDSYRRSSGDQSEESRDS